MKKVKFLAILIVLVMIAGCAGIGGGGGAAPAAPADGPLPAAALDDAKTSWTIAIAGINLDDGMNATTEQEAEGFNTLAATILADAFPGHSFEFIAVPWDGAAARIHTLLETGGADLITQGGAFIPQLHAEGLIQSLTPFIERDESAGTWSYNDVFFDNLRYHPHTNSFDGTQTLTLPWQIGYRVIIQDSLLFEQWGVPLLPEFPTPQQILEAGRQMTGINPVTGEQNYGIWIAGNSLNMSYLEAAAAHFGDLGVSGNFDDPASLEWSLNSPGFVSAVQWAVDVGRYAPVASATGQGSERFGQPDNDVAITIDRNGGPIIGHYLRTGDYAMIERFVPTMHIAPNGGNWTPVDGMAMNAQLTGADADMAWEILKFMTGREVMTWFFSNWGPFAMGNRVIEDIVNPRDRFMQMNNRIVANAVIPGFEMNPFYGVSMQPVFAELISRSIAGEEVDVQSAMDDLQDQAIAWSRMQ